jgi:alanyl aminopeptidase
LQRLALASDDAVFRGRALGSLGAGGHPGASRELLQLALSAQLHDNEIYDILDPQLRDEATRDAAWDWLRRNFDALLARIPDWRKGRLAGAGAYFCDPAHRAEVEAFFRPKTAQLSGAPRALANALESIDLCMAKKAFHEPGLKRLLAQ